MITGIADITVLIILAAGLSTLAHLFRQPVVLAYLATGALIGAFHYLDLGHGGQFSLFSDLGIMFLLFLIGLEINYESLRHVGKTAFVIGIGQIIFTSFFGFLLALAFQLPPLSAGYVAIALTFSSTVIIVKLLSEKKDLNSLYGKISLGFLLVQDLVAVLLLVAFSSLEGDGGSNTWSTVLSTLLIGFGLFAFMFYLGRKILPRVFDLFARSQELLFLITLAWLFGVATAVSWFGFSVEIGGLLAGLSLANSSERFQIANKIRPLRDFFVLVFFAILGSAIATADYSGLAFPVIAFSLFVLIGNPLIVLTLMGLMGYRRRTSFMAGVTVAQISEFSLILMALGFRVGHVQQSEVALVTAVGVITITLSSYLVMNGEKIFNYLEPFLGLFERRTPGEYQLPEEQFRKSVVLLGAHRTGQSIAWHVPASKLVVVDFDPAVVERLKKQKIDFLFGDFSDEELRQKIDFSKVKIIVSTLPSLDDNMGVIRIAQDIQKSLKRHFYVVVRAKNEIEVQLLYKAGADYVLLPHFTAGEYLGQLVATRERFDFLNKLRDKDRRMITKENGVRHG